MNLVKMRDQRRRAGGSARPLDLIAHPESRMQWAIHAVLSDDHGVHTVCVHCGRLTPCPSEVYLHEQEGHTPRCDGPAFCEVFARAELARERELV